MSHADIWKKNNSRQREHKCSLGCVKGSKEACVAGGMRVTGRGFESEVRLVTGMGRGWFVGYSKDFSFCTRGGRLENGPEVTLDLEKRPREAET